MKRLRSRQRRVAAEGAAVLVTECRQRFVLVLYEKHNGKAAWDCGRRRGAKHQSSSLNPKPSTLRDREGRIAAEGATHSIKAS
jgi:hypothetical protein